MHVSNFTIIPSFESTLAGVICYCKMMTSVMALEGVTSFLRLKDFAIKCKYVRHSPTMAGFLQCYCDKLEEADNFKCVFVVYCVFESK